MASRYHVFTILVRAVVHKCVTVELKLDSNFRVATAYNIPAQNCEPRALCRTNQLLEGRAFEPPL